jgi:hypothetical protein
VFGYEGKNVLKVIAEGIIILPRPRIRPSFVDLQLMPSFHPSIIIGPGFVNEAKEHLIPTECRYVLLRKVCFAIPSSTQRSSIHSLTTTIFMAGWLAHWLWLSMIITGASC